MPLKVQRWGFRGVQGVMVRVFRCFGVYGVEDFSVGLYEVGCRVLNLGLAGQKRPENVRWGSILTPSRKNAQNS